MKARRSIATSLTLLPTLLVAACASSSGSAPGLGRQNDDPLNSLLVAGHATTAVAGGPASELRPTATLPFARGVGEQPAAAPPGSAWQDDDEVEATAPQVQMMPVGVGLALAPEAFLIGGALDVPLDKQLTVGPAIQLALDDQDTSLAVFGQAKYFPPLDGGDPDSIFTKLRPYAQAGAGYVWLDREGQKSDSDFLLNVGGGVRYRTGDDYRLGTNLLLNFMPDDPSGDTFFITWEIIQVSFEF